MKGNSFPNYFTRKVYLDLYNLRVSEGVLTPVLDQAQLDLGRPASDVIEAHGLKHSRDVRLCFGRCEDIFGVFVLQIFSKVDKTCK